MAMQELRGRDCGAGSLWAALWEVTDQPGWHGRRHPPASLQTISVFVMLCGCGSDAVA